MVPLGLTVNYSIAFSMQKRQANGALTNCYAVSVYTNFNQKCKQIVNKCVKK